MNQPINNSNVLALAWAVIKPYVLEAPTLLMEEYDWLERTNDVSEILTSPEHLFSYMSFVPDESYRHTGAVTDFFKDTRISRTQRFKKLPENQQLPEHIDVVNIFNCFLNIFSLREKHVKDNYRELLEASFYSYKHKKFYHITTHDLNFLSFNDFIRYFDMLCAEFSANVVLSKDLVEYFCTLMISVVSRYYRLKHVLSPSYAYLGLLPLYATAGQTSPDVRLMMSVPVNHCFSGIPRDSFYEEETPELFNFILKHLIGSLQGSLLDYLSPESIFNMNITNIGEICPAKNIFALTRRVFVGGHSVQIFSYNGTLDDYIMLVNIEHKHCHFVYTSIGLRENNASPLAIPLLPMFVVNNDTSVRRLDEEETSAFIALIKELRPIFLS